MALLTNIDNKFSVSDAGAVRFNNAFTFPTADGTANYVLKTNGSGQLAWAPDLNSDAVTKIIGGTNITVSPATGLGDVTVNADLSGTVTGTGVDNRIAIWNGTTAIDSDSDFYVDGDTIFTTNLEASGNGSFSGTLTATNYFSSTTAANIFLGSVITKPGDNLGFVIRNTTNAVIGSFLRTSNTTSKLTTDNLSLGGTTAQYVRGDGSFATFSPGTGTVTGSGSATRVAFWSSGSAITSDADLYWDNTNKRLGIGISSIDAKLQIDDGSIKIRNIVTSSPDNAVQRLINVASFDGGGNTYTGKLIIQTPVMTTGAMVKLKISGWQYDESWDLTVSGYMRFGANRGWQQIGGSILTGNPPFGVDEVRLAYNDTTNIFYVILGSSTTFWDYYASIIVDADQFYQDSVPTTGWDMSVSTSDPSGLVNTVTLTDIAKYGTGGDSALIPGNVGIGVTDPDAKLEIKASGSTTGLTFKTTDAAGNENFFIQDGGRTGVRFYPFTVGQASGTSAASGARFQVATTAGDFVVLNDGKVGIGTDSPSTKLEVVTTTSSTAIRCNVGQSSDIFLGFTGANPELLLQDNANIVTHRFESNGDNYIVGSNVGIGNTSPAQQLDILYPSYIGKDTVQGLIRLTGQSNTENGAGTLSAGVALEFYNKWTGGVAYSMGRISGRGEQGYDGGLQFDVGTNTAPGQSGFTTAMTINADANVGIGATTPLRKLHVAGGSGFAVNASTTQYYGVYIPALGEGADPRIDIGDWHNAGSTIKWDSTARSLNLDTQYSTSAGTFNITGNDGANTFLTILPGGNVGIGRTAPDYKLVVSNSNNEGIEFGPGYTSGANLFQNYNRTNSQYVRADWVASTHQWYQGDTASVEVRMSLTGSGVLTVKNDIVAYGSPSDIRLKENIKPIKSALDKVSKLQGVTFDWKESDSILNIKEDIGFIAQDVQKVIPELVRENDNGMLSMRHQGIAPILLEAIKELKAEIEELKLNNCNCK